MSHNLKFNTAAIDSPENAVINKTVLFGLVSYILKPYFET